MDYSGAMTPTCGNCKFWSMDGLDPEMFRDYGGCTSQKVQASLGDPKSIGIVADCDYPLLFGRDFGCIHFTAKDAVPFTTWIKHD